MPWGSKRSRHDYTQCSDCMDPIDMEDEDWMVCGECEEALCSECMKNDCDVCKDREDKGLDLMSEGTSCCETCMDFCKRCENDDEGFLVSAHKMCMIEHMENCNALTRSEGAYKAAKMQREKKEEDLESAQAQLATLQRRIESLREDVRKSRQEEGAAKSKMEAAKAEKKGANVKKSAS